MNVKERNTLNVTASGVNSLDLIGERATGEDFSKVRTLLEMNYGVEYPKEKFAMLFDLIQEENWSKERLKATFRWFIKTKKYPDWKIADWFEYGEKLYPYCWYQEQISKGVRHEDMQGYRVNGKVLWKLKDNVDLPFEKV